MLIEFGYVCHSQTCEDELCEQPYPGLLQVYEESRGQNTFNHFPLKQRQYYCWRRENKLQAVQVVIKPNLGACSAC